MGAAGVAAASALIPAGGALARSHRGSINEWGVFASTTEALTVTITSELVRRTSKHPEVPSSVSAIFDAVYAAERDHWRFTSKHWRPSTTRFWIPDGFFGGAGDALDLTAVGKSVAGGEHLFVNTYLIGVTIFAAAGRSTCARYAAEFAANESEHRVPGQSLAGASPPKRPSLRRVRIRSRESDRRRRQKRGLRLRRAGNGRRSLLRPPAAADGPAGPDQLEPTTIGRTQRKPGPAGPKRLQPGRVDRLSGLNRFRRPAQMHRRGRNDSPQRRGSACGPDFSSRSDSLTVARVLVFVGKRERRH
jgi:hypothetical protein